MVCIRFGPKDCNLGCASTVFSRWLPIGYLLILLKYIISASNVVVQIICYTFKTKIHQMTEWDMWFSSAMPQLRPRFTFSSFAVRNCDWVTQVIKLTFWGNYNPITCKCNSPLWHIILWFIWCRLGHHTNHKLPCTMKTDDPHMV